VESAVVRSVFSTPPECALPPLGHPCAAALGAAV